MQRRPARRAVYYHSAAYPDGAAVACAPMRKPSAKSIREQELKIDPDMVVREARYAVSQFPGWDVEFRVRCADILANRLNMRRTVRDLVLPKIKAMESTLASMQKQLQRIEDAIKSLPNCS